MAKAKSKEAVKVKAAQSREEASFMVGEIGRFEREVDVLEKRMNDRLAKIKEEFEAEAAPLNAKIEELVDGVTLWAEANRASLLTDGGKTVKLDTGDVSWRTNPPKVRVQGEDVVIERLKKAGLTDLVRTVEEVNKEGVLADPARVEGIKGITVTQGETIYVKPFESEIERASTKKKAA